MPIPGVHVAHGWRTVLTHSAPDAQSVNLGVNALRLASREEDVPAGLALIASLRKRLVNMPGKLPANERCRVRQEEVERRKTGRCHGPCLSGCTNEPSGTCATGGAVGMPFNP